MINESMYRLGNAPSAIRELFAYGMERKAQIGEDKVFDFSIGNPSVPAPPKVAQVIRELSKMPPAELHAYSQASGLDSAKTAIADNLNRRFGTDYAAKNLYLTTGAASCLSCCIKAVLLNPGDEIIVISPYFPEYRVWIEADGGKCVEVPAREDDFQIDLDALAAAINERTRAVIINSPNNPVGVVYTRETLEGLSALLHKKREELGGSLYLISDEPYRELAYGAEVPWVPAIYDNTLVCYSWSKSLSLPGDRIGYVLVPNGVEESERVMFAIAGAGRALGYICAPVFFQRVIAACVDEPVNAAAYAANRELLTKGLDELGYHYIAPDGAFYLWMQALEPDAQAFSDKAKEHELLLVPSDSFGVGGWVRIGYCVSADTIKNSMPAFAALKKAYE